MKTNNRNSNKQISSKTFLNSNHQSTDKSLDCLESLTKHIDVKDLDIEDIKDLVLILKANEESRTNYKILQQIITLTGVTVLIVFGSNIVLTYLGKNNDFLNTTSQTVTTSVIGLATTTIGFVLGKNSNKQNK